MLSCAIWALFSSMIQIGIKQFINFRGGGHLVPCWSQFLFIYAVSLNADWVGPSAQFEILNCYVGLQAFACIPLVPALLASSETAYRNGSRDLMVPRVSMPKTSSSWMFVFQLPGMYYMNVLQWNTWIFHICKVVHFWVCDEDMQFFHTFSRFFFTTHFHITATHNKFVYLCNILPCCLLLTILGKF